MNPLPLPIQPRIDPRDVAAAMSANRERLMGIAASIQSVTRTIDLTPTRKEPTNG